MKLSEMSAAQRRISNFAVAASVAVLGAVAFIHGAPAEAKDGKILGYNVTVVNNGPGTHDAMTIYGPAGIETMGVKCTGNGGYEWNSYGPNDVVFNDAVAAYWCEGY